MSNYFLFVVFIYISIIIAILIYTVIPSLDGNNTHQPQEYNTLSIFLNISSIILSLIVISWVFINIIS